MSALTDLFSAMANKIRSKTGTATTYTPSEMVSDGIDDVYDAGVASATTPITPSNSSPASMTANTGYKPTANGYAIQSYEDITPSNSNPIPLEYRFYNMYRIMGNGGYAIESYSSVTPSSTQTAVSSGDIVKIGGSGVIVDSVPTPTSITPSNSSPVALTANTPVNPTASGYAIASYSSVTPSNSSPVSLSSGSIYKTGGSGYAISSYSSKTPSDTSPASVSSGAIIKASSAGYLVKNTPVDLSTPDLVSNADMSASGTRTISVTQKPRYIVCVMTRYGSSQTDGRCYISLVDVARNTSRKVERGSSSYDSGTTQSGLTDNVTAVSASSVTIKNAVSVTVRSMVMIYY